MYTHTFDRICVLLLCVYIPVLNKQPTFLYTYTAIPVLFGSLIAIKVTNTSGNITT